MVPDILEKSCGHISATYNTNYNKQTVGAGSGTTRVLGEKNTATDFHQKYDNVSSDKSTQKKMQNGGSNTTKAVTDKQNEIMRGIGKGINTWNMFRYVSDTQTTISGELLSKQEAQNYLKQLDESNILYPGDISSVGQVKSGLIMQENNSPKFRLCLICYKLMQEKS